MDEFGVTDKGNIDERVKAVKYYLSVSEKYGVPCVWWDNGGTGTGGEKYGLINRSTCEWHSPEIVKALMDSTK